MNGIAEGTYRTKHAEAIGSSIQRDTYTHINTGTTDTHHSLSSDTLVNVDAGGERATARARGDLDMERKIRMHTMIGCR